ncbi:hypothetical protein HpHA38_19530 [Helicobacter pylori]
MVFKKQKKRERCFNPKFIPKKGGSWWAIHLSVMSGVGGSKRLAMTAQA